MAHSRSRSTILSIFLGLSMLGGCGGRGGQDHGGGAVGAGETRGGGIDASGSENIGYPGQGPGGAGARSLDNTSYEGRQ
ncbi:hypothetical protein BH23PLA1_BH23PLA1_01180 [soil metagenome]